MPTTKPTREGLIEGYERTMATCEQTRLPEAMAMLDWICGHLEDEPEGPERVAVVRGRLATLRECLPSIQAALDALEAYSERVEDWLAQ